MSNIFWISRDGESILKFHIADSSVSNCHYTVTACSQKVSVFSELVNNVQNNSFVDLKVQYVPVQKLIKDNELTHPEKYSLQKKCDN